MLLWGFLGVVALVIGTLVWRNKRRHRRVAFIQAYRFDSSYRQALRFQYPDLKDADIQLAEKALRQFFTMHALQPQATFHMPSRLADVLWHAFIVDTRRYLPFCQQAFGALFHHIPSHAMPQPAAASRRESLQATWNAAMLTKRWMPGAILAGVPLLFALDAAASIHDGMVYSDTDLRNFAVAMALATGGSAAGLGSTDASGSSYSSSDTTYPSYSSYSDGGGSDCNSTSSTSVSSDSSSSNCDSSSSSSCGGGCGGGGGGSD